jgi:hypothetical protein
LPPRSSRKEGEGNASSTSIAGLKAGCLRSERSRRSAFGLDRATGYAAPVRLKQSNLPDRAQHLLVSKVAIHGVGRRGPISVLLAGLFHSSSASFNQYELKAFGIEAETPITVWETP